MYLAKPNNLPGYENEAVMELKSNDEDAREGKIELTFLNPKTKIMKIQMSILGFHL